MSDTLVTPTELDRLLRAVEAEFPDGTPALMLNMLRYREIADEEPLPGAAPRTGRQAYYDSYLPSFRRVVQDEGIEGVEIDLVGTVRAGLLAPADERWDDVAVVRYPSFSAFRRIATSARYAREAEPFRTAALAELRLYATSPVDPSTL